jgi:hypothetical protein
LSADKAFKKGLFVDAANKPGSAFADTEVSESAVNMERVKIVFDF